MFWIFAVLLVLLVVGTVLRPLLFRGRAEETALELNLRVYRDQLDTLDADVARGVLPEEHAQSARVEISRRILAADRRSRDGAPAGSARPAVTRTAALVLAVLIGAGSFGLYGLVGSPGMRDLPLAFRLEAARNMRMSQDDAERAKPEESMEVGADHADLMVRLRAAVAARPSDVIGLRLLAENEARIGRLASARKAQQQLVELLGSEAAVNDVASLALYMVDAAGGYVSPEAERILARALALDPDDMRARYLSGLALAQTGQPAQAMRIWQSLIAESPDAPWVPEVRRQLKFVQAAFGLAGREDGAAPALAAADVAAAREMDAVDRRAMIRAMVQGLADRLDADGGTPAEWARLIRAYGVLERQEAAVAAWTAARDAFAGDAEAVAMLESVAAAAGVQTDSAGAGGK